MLEPGCRDLFPFRHKSISEVSTDVGDNVWLVLDGNEVLPQQTGKSISMELTGVLSR